MLLILLLYFSTVSIGQSTSQKNQISVLKKAEVAQVSGIARNNDSENKYTEDSLWSESKTSQIPKIKDFDKATCDERRILIKRTHEAQCQLIIQKRNVKLFGSIAFAFVLSFIGYLFYNHYSLTNKQSQKTIGLKEALLQIENQNKLQEQRSRISSELYDTIGAQLTFIISSIDNLKYSFSISDQKLNEELTNISDLTSETIYELRDTIWALNKTEITLEELQSRLTNYIEKASAFNEKINFSVHVANTVDFKKSFSTMQGVTIYRIIQETIHNTLKHAKARSININIEEFQEQTKITISDDGLGFNSSASEKGNGLINMQKRANDINANLQILSKVSEGTKVIIII